ncbi:hypothetical protein GOBAR_DD23058 [Gossypium barbadense]|nr:hypothetical protein GOBAR_DD23058 [Gossypium barbadense]
MEEYTDQSQEKNTKGKLVLNITYTVPHKLALRNWMPSKNKSSVNKDLGRLLYKVGKEIRINLGKMLFSTNGVNDLVHLAFIPTDVEIDEAPNPSVVAAETGQLLELLRSELDSLSVEMQRLAAKKAKLAEIICNLEKTPW